MNQKLNRIKLENFRSYENLDFAFEKPTTIITGPNGHGKTNLLEAIYTLSIGQSFRTSDYTNLVNWNSDYGRVFGEIEHPEISSTEAFFSKSPKQKNYKLDGINKKQSSFIGHLLTVLFHPEDLNMLYLSPVYRRTYLDIILSQTNREYLYALSQYRKVLKHKNALLKQFQKQNFEYSKNNNQTDLQIWNYQLVEFGSKIIASRKQLLEQINLQITPLYREISDHKENISINYQNKILNTNSETQEIKNTFLTLLEQYQQREILSGNSLIGPHRDDIIFSINDHNITTSASRGEFRSLLLAIKLAEIKYIKEKTGISPLLLLDDVFSELDIYRQNHLLNAIGDSQAIITTTSIHPDQKIIKNNTDINIVQIQDLC